MNSVAKRLRIFNSLFLFLFSLGFICVLLNSLLFSQYVIDLMRAYDVESFQFAAHTLNLFVAAIGMALFVFGALSVLRLVCEGNNGWLSSRFVKINSVTLVIVYCWLLRSFWGGMSAWLEGEGNFFFAGYFLQVSAAVFLPWVWEHYLRLCVEPDDRKVEIIGALSYRLSFQEREEK